MPVRVKVFGDYACFSRPEFKVERVSYPVITPSAARGVLEAIFWKPEIRYQIRQIHVLKLGSQASVLRNEVSEKQSGHPFIAQEKRQQRTSLVLRKISYIIHAEIIFREHVKSDVGKYLDQFRRRVEKGQCHHMPSLGNREFAASFEEPLPAERGDPGINLEIGQMLFDLAFIESRDGKGELEFIKPGGSGQRKVKGCTAALFFPAQVKGGVLDVPREKYAELYALEQSGA
jgi:CRISPR-associated protein Cas5d